MFKEKLTHARFDLPKPDRALLGAGHPLTNERTHQRLLEYLTDRLDLGASARDARVAHYSQVDRDVAAFMKLSDEDRKRSIEHAKTGKPLATEISLPLMFVHLDDMMTYYAQTFAPNRGMFYHTASPDQTDPATQLVAKMNYDAVYTGYYRQLLRSVFCVLKYNAGGLINSWDKEYAPKLAPGEIEGSTKVEMDVQFTGNRLKAVDMYNFLCDPAPELQDLHKDGEWVATVEMASHYWLKARCLEGKYVNCHDMLDDESFSSLIAKYYKSPPVESRLADDGQLAQQFSWYSFLTGADSFMLNGAFEITTMYIKLNPNDFGLIKGNSRERAARNRYEVWRITLLNGERIIEAEWMNNIHGHLPAYMGVLNDDWMRDSSKSVADILNPLQQFSSFLLNAHVKATRKNIYGTTYYDPSVVDLAKVPEGEVAARVPINPQGWGKDLRTFIMHDNNNLDTKQTLQDLQGMMGLIDQFFPTQSLPSQIAGIDRAVDSQVAAVQQGSNRRQQKGARLLDETMLRPMRFSMYYNIVQYQKDGEEVSDFYTGKTTTMNLENLRGMNLSTIIGQGLKALDRQAMQGMLRDIIFAMIQAPQVSQEIDLLGLLDHWTSMMDLETNLTQFKKAAPAAAPGAESPGGAVEAGIVPATNPAAITEPIYG